MKRTFLYTDDKSNKFWTIETNGSSYTVNYGKTGTAGQTQSKDFADEATCQKAVEKLIAEKTKKGYTETDELPAATPKADKPAAKKYKTFMKAYESESDKEDGDEDYMYEVINVDVEDKDHVIAAIKALSKKLNDEEFIEEMEENGSFPQFGKVVDKVFIEIDNPDDDDYTFDAFYRKAASYKEVRPTLKKFCEQVININRDNSGCPFWQTEEDLFGISPAFALALADKKYIDTAIDMMCSMYNGDHHTPAEYSSELLEKWGPCPETIKYFAASVIAMPMQDLSVQIYTAMNNDAYKKYFKDEKNIDVFLKYYAEYLKEAPHYGYSNENNAKKLVERMIEPLFEEIFADNSQKANEMGTKFVALLVDGKQATYQLLKSN